MLAIVMSDDEVLELYRFMRFGYLSPNAYPALTRLVARVDRRAQELHAQLDVDRDRRTTAVGVSLSRDVAGLDCQ